MAGYGMGGAPPPAEVIRAALARTGAAPKTPALTGKTLRATVGVPKTPRTTKAAAAYDPFAPLTPQQINQTVTKYTAGYGQPQTPAQIQASAQGMLDPIVAAITANVGKQTSAAAENIRGNTASLAAELGKINYGAPYQGAEGKQAAVDAALQQSLSGAGGTELAQGLESRLSQIGGGSVQDAAAGLAARGAAIGTNQQAVGSGALSNLISNEASAQSYGQKLPGIAGMQGLQDITRVQQQGVKDIGDQTSQVMQQLPQIVEHLRDAAMNLSGTRAAAAAQLYEQLTGQNITKAVSKAGLQNDQAQYGLDVAKAQQGAAYDAQRAGIAQQNADTSTYRAQTGAQAAAKRNQIAAQKAATAKKTAKPLSTSDKRAALKAADLYYYGQHPTLRADGSEAKAGIPGINYGQAIRQLVQGYGLSVPQATKMANTYYKPGERGRPGRPSKPEKLRPKVKSGGPLGVQAQVPQ